MVPKQLSFVGLVWEWKEPAYFSNQLNTAATTSLLPCLYRQGKTVKKSCVWCAWKEEAENGWSKRISQCHGAPGTLG